MIRSFLLDGKFYVDRRLFKRFVSVSRVYYLKIIRAYVDVAAY